MNLEHSESLINPLEDVPRKPRFEETLGGRLKLLRITNNITLDELSSQLGYSKGRLSQLENGPDDKFPRRAILAYSQYFNLDPDTLVQEIPTPIEQNLDLTSKPTLSLTETTAEGTDLSQRVASALIGLIDNPKFSPNQRAAAILFTHQIIASIYTMADIIALSGQEMPTENNNTVDNS